MDLFVHAEDVNTADAFVIKAVFFGQEDPAMSEELELKSIRRILS